MSSLPILYFHLGYQPYLNFSIAQSRFSHPDSRVILIGDQRNAGKTTAEHLMAADYSERATQFAEIYQHLSTNSCEFELRCFQRWYIFLEVMEQNDMEAALICDSDTMLYENFSRFSQQNPSIDCGLNVVHDQENSIWAACPHVAYWRREALQDFCAFNNRLYQPLDSRLNERWQGHLKENIPGGICDMTALYLFFTELAPEKKVNFLRIVDNSVVDLNAGSSHNYLPKEFQLRNGQKQLFFRNGQPYGFYLPEQKEVRFKALHCQGSNKWLMPRLYQGSKRMTAARFSVFARYGLRTTPRRLLQRLR